MAAGTALFKEELESKSAQVEQLEQDKVALQQQLAELTAQLGGALIR